MISGGQTKMANRARSSSSNLSLRQSLGMPLRGIPSQPQPHHSTAKTKPVSKRPSSGPNNHRQSVRQTLNFGTSRPSTGRSSIYGTSQMKKDPRPLSDKGYQTESIKKLVKFLADNNYPKTLTVKSLQTPTCREFLHIINFILEMLDDSFVFDGVNMVEAVPTTLKILGYPFNVSKNHLLNVGSPHSWPILLGALSWLIDCCSIPDNTSNIFFSQGEGFDDEEAHRAEVNYKVEELMYSVYMTTETDSEEYHQLVQARREAARNDCAYVESQIEAVQEEQSQLNEALNKLSESSLPVLQKELQEKQEECEALHHDLQNKVAEVETKKAEIIEKEGRRSEIEMQLEASKMKILELEEHIRHQPMSASDAHNLHQSIKDAEEMLEKKQRTEEDSLERVSELQMQHNKSVLLIDSICQKINGKLHRLAALVPDVASLPSLDYDTSKRANPEVLHKLVDHAKVLRNEIQKLHQNIASNILGYEGKIISAESAASTLHTEHVRKELEVSNLQHSIEMTQETLDQKRRLSEEAMKTEQEEKHLLEKEILSMQQRLRTESQAEKHYLSVHQQCESERTAILAELKEKDDTLEDLVLLLTQFIEALHEHQDGVRNIVDKLLERFKALKILGVPQQYLDPFNDKI